MPAAISSLGDSSFLSEATADAREARATASTERQREFECIASHSLPFFRRVAMRQLGNHQDAEDAVQDAMLLAFRNIGQFAGRASMTTWLTAIVINTARMQLRRRRRCQLLSLDQTTESGKATISQTLVDSAPTPERDLEQSELRELVARLTRSLSPTQQATLLLSQRETLSGKQMAQTLGVPEGTVKARLNRGRTQLAQRFRAMTAKPKSRTSNSGSKGRRDTPSSGYRADYAQGIKPVPAAVLRQQGGCKAAVAV